MVEVPDSSKHFGGRGAYKFDDITMVPIQKKLINVDLLTDSEVRFNIFILLFICMIDIK